MSKKTKRFLLLLIGIILLSVLAFWFKGWVAIDRCLDSGGRWNYDKRACEYSDAGTGK